MLKAYIAGPLRGDGTEYAITQNRAHAASVARDLWRAGFSVFCPHLNTAGMVGLLDNCGGEEVFINGDLEWLMHTNILFVLNGWKTSKGAQREVDYAWEHRIPIAWETKDAREQTACSSYRWGLGVQLYTLQELYNILKDITS